VMESRESLHFESFMSRSVLEGYMSRHKTIALILQNRPTSTTRLSKTSVIQCAFCLLYQKVKNNVSRQEKCQKFKKRFNFKVNRKI